MSTNASPATVEPLPRRSAFGKLLFCLLSLVGLWVAGAWGSDWLADRALDHRRLLSADRWDQWTTRLRLGRTNWSRRLTLDRKLGRFDALNAHAKHAQNAGLSERRISHEFLLVSAQAGETDSPEAVLAEIIQGDQISGREIFEAFTNGAIANYQVEEALYLLDSWERDYPTDPMPALLRGRIAEHRNDWTDSVAHYENALKLSPQFGPAAYNLARVKLGQSQLAEAEVWYQTAAEILELPQPAWVGQAHCHRLSGALAEAEQLLERVLATDNAVRELAYRQVGDTGDSGRTSPLMERGELRLAQKQPSSAVADFEAALREQPMNSAIRFHLASALRAAGRVEEAQKEYESVRVAREALATLTPTLDRVRQDPQDPEARTALGRLFLNYISERQGEAWLHSALRVDPAYAPAHAALSRHYQKKQPQTPDLRQLAEWHAQAAGTALEEWKQTTPNPPAETAPAEPR